MFGNYILTALTAIVVITFSALDMQDEHVRVYAVRIVITISIARPCKADTIRYSQWCWRTHDARFVNKIDTQLTLEHMIFIYVLQFEDE